jgi:hypothetical protein
LVSHRDRLVTSLLKRVDAEHAWYRDLSAEDRSWVGLVAQASISAFIAWCEHRDSAPRPVTEIFAVAPRELTQTVSLQHTLQLVRSGVDVIEDEAEVLSAPGRAAELHEALLRYSREFAFATAEVYARAAEMRGSWDARLEALVVDALLTADDVTSLRSRAAALGWRGEGQTMTAVAGSPTGPKQRDVNQLRRAIRAAVPDSLVGFHSDRTLLVLGGPGDLRAALESVIGFLGDGPVVIGPLVPSFDQAGPSARAANAGFDAVVAWPRAPRPVMADDLLPERLLGGDPTARESLLTDVYNPLLALGADAVTTLGTYLDTGRSLEAAARLLYLHPNTVRYRLRKITSACGWDPSDPREAYVLQTALAVGRLHDREAATRAR